MTLEEQYKTKSNKFLAEVVMDNSSYIDEAKIAASLELKSRGITNKEIANLQEAIFVEKQELSENTIVGDIDLGIMESAKNGFGLFLPFIFKPGEAIVQGLCFILGLLFAYDMYALIVDSRFSGIESNLYAYPDLITLIAAGVLLWKKNKIGWFLALYLFLGPIIMEAPYMYYLSLGLIYETTFDRMALSGFLLLYVLMLWYLFNEEVLELLELSSEEVLMSTIIIAIYSGYIALKFFLELRQIVAYQTF